MKKKLLSLALMLLGSAMTTSISAQVIIDQKFDDFTEGSEATPATTDITGYSGKLYKTIGWNGKSVYEAGGMLFVKDGGYLLTERFTKLTSTSTVKVTFDMKSPASYGGAVTVNFNYAYSGDQTIMVEDNQWHTVSVIINNASSTKQVKFTPFLAAEGLLIDNVKVEAGAFLQAPEAKQPKKASKTEFTAEWGKVTGATAYLLDVYTKSGDAKSYLFKDSTVTTTSQAVTSLDAAKTYYYVVRAKADTVVSEYSNEIEVVEVFDKVDAPVATEATNVSASGFTANWNAAENATKYEVYVNRVEVLSADKEVNVLAEDFSKVTEGTLSSPEFVSSRSLDKYTNLPGWSNNYTACIANGYMGIAPLGSSGYITTPTIDLSQNGGAFCVKMKMAEYNYGKLSGGTKFELRLYNGETLKETKTVTIENDESKVYTFDFTSGGTADSYLEFYYKNSDSTAINKNKLLIDDITVSQQLKKGDKLVSVAAQKEVGNTTSEKFDLELSNDVSYTYCVIAYAPAVVDGELDYVSSEVSNVITVKYSTDGISQATAGKGEATVVSRMNAAGQMISAPQKGINILKLSDGSTVKVLVK